MEIFEYSNVIKINTIVFLKEYKDIIIFSYE